MTAAAAATAPGPQPANDPAPAEAWFEPNRAAIELGGAWLRHCLDDAEGSGGQAEAARDAYAAARAALAASGTPAALDRLAAVFDLAPFDEDVLLLALAARRDAAIAVACAARHGRTGFEAPTVHLALALFAPGREAEALAWQRLSSEAPLRRFRLLDMPAGPPTLRTALTLDERLELLLLGVDGEERMLRRVLTAPAPTIAVARDAPAIDALARRVQAAERPVAILAGRAGGGRAAAARALAGRFGLGLAQLAPSAFDRADELLPLVAREAALERFAVLIEPPPGEARRWLEQRIDALAILLVEDARSLPPEVPLLHLGPLGQADRVAMWQAALGARASALDPPVAALADQFRLGPAEIAAVALEADDPWPACRARAGRDLEALAERIAPRRGWDDLVLPGDVLRQLRAVASQVRHRALVHYDHGFEQRLPRGGGISVLLAGPSGVGKSMTAEVIAGDLALDLFRVDLSRVVSKYIGETEKNLAAVFDAAESGGAVLFFDEADALFGKRSEVKDSHDRYANIETSYLLQRMESYSGLAILATNMKANLDSAFSRRLRFVIDLPPPDAALRRAIWRKAFPPATPLAPLDYDALARLDIAGGNIAVIAVNAAFLAAAEGTAVAMRHIGEAARAEFRKLDKDFQVPATGAWA